MSSAALFATVDTLGLNEVALAVEKVDDRVTVLLSGYVLKVDFEATEVDRANKFKEQ